MLTKEGIMRVPGLLSRWAQLHTGVKAHYVTAGESGPAVVLLHGGIIGSSGIAGWRLMAPFLAARGFRVYCPDMPAFGLTLDPEGVYLGPGGHIDFLHDLTTHLHLQRFHLAGNSMGCMNTVNYMLAHPERIESFALIAGPVGDLVPGQDYRWFNIRTSESQPNTRRFDGSPESMRSMLEAILHGDGEIDEDLVMMRTEAANRQRSAYEQHVAARDATVTGKAPNLAARLSTKGRLDCLTIPGIYLYGENDRFSVHEYAYPQEDVLPNIQFFYPRDCGHQGQTDQPELFNQVLLEFFSTGRVSAETAVRAGISQRRPPLDHLVAPR